MPRNRLSDRHSSAEADGLKETARACRVSASTIEEAVPLWPLHRARLLSGGCRPESVDEAEPVALEALAGWQGGTGSRLRLTVTISPEGAASAEVSRRLSSLDVPKGPVAVPVHVGELPHLPANGAKPADRRYWDAAMRDARSSGGHQAILMGPDDALIDGGTATVWLVSRGRLLTPPSPSAIAGVARRFVFESAPGLGIEVRETSLYLEDFAEADEAFLTNAFGGAVAVRGRGGHVFERIRGAFDAIWEA